MVQGQTVAGAGSDAAIVRLPGTMKALALSTDGKGRFGALDPYLGAMHAVAEAARNVAVTGARPLAITNCLNFGNPERPVVMWQFAESIRGMRDACLALDTPVTGGNVSFYNESGDSAIWPTPVIGMLGAARGSSAARARPASRGRGLAVYLLGETFAELGGSEFAEVGARRASAAVRRRSISPGTRAAVDCSSRPRAPTCSRARTTAPTAGSRSRWWSRRSRAATGSPSRSRPTCRRTWRCSARAPRAPWSERRARARGGVRGARRAHGVPARATRARPGGPRVVFDGMLETTVAELREIYETAIPRLLGEAV